MSFVDKIGDRMKANYENISKHKLTRRTPVIIRLDGCAFHTFTRKFVKPFDDLFSRAMQETTKYLCEHVQGCKIGYTQSDEITLLLIDYDTLETSAWFDYKLEKITSVAASMAALAFNRAFGRLMTDRMKKSDNDENQNVVYYNAFEKGAYFDARAFNIPKEEVNNCFVWRQLDAERNAINSVAQSLYSQNELCGKKLNDTRILIAKKDHDITTYPVKYQRGSCCIKRYDEQGCSEWIIDENIPRFSEDKNYVEQYVFLDE